MKRGTGGKMTELKPDYYPKKFDGKIDKLHGGKMKDDELDGKIDEAFKSSIGNKGTVGMVMFKEAKTAIRELIEDSNRAVRKEWFDKGLISGKRSKNTSGCCCILDKDDDLVQKCAAHKEWEDKEIATLQEQLKVRDKQFQTLHNAVRKPYKTIIEENTILKAEYKRLLGVLKKIENSDHSKKCNITYGIFKTSCICHVKLAREARGSE